jgi:pyruvate dehydrogenase E1 component alpha subunit
LARALNFAAIWKLPVIFFENNLWMEYTRTSDVTAVANPAADRAAAYELESIITLWECCAPKRSPPPLPA